MTQPLITRQQRNDMLNFVRDRFVNDVDVFYSFTDLSRIARTLRALRGDKDAQNSLEAAAQRSAHSTWKRAIRGLGL